MMKDLKRLRAQTNGEKIITKHEWMMSALDKLEKYDKEEAKKKNPSAEEDPVMFDEETPQMLYEALFIDPSKLTPYQHAQLEY